MSNSHQMCPSYAVSISSTHFAVYRFISLMERGAGVKSAKLVLCLPYSCLLLSLYIGEICCDFVLLWRK